MNKFFLVFIILLLVLNTVNAVNVNCGRPVIINGSATGDYVFSNEDNNSVIVKINNKFSAVSIIPNNTFILTFNESKTIAFRAQTDMYARLFVTSTDLSNGFSASLECPFFATSENKTTTTIPTTTSTIETTSTTTTIPICYNLDFFYCSMQSTCRWTGDFRFGRCISLTTTSTSTTTIQSTTTTIQSSCSGKSYSQCILTQGCRWIGDFRVGYCMQSTTTTVPITTTTTQQTTTTIAPTTTTICPSVCIRWLRPFICLEWSTKCDF